MKHFKLRSLLMIGFGLLLALSVIANVLSLLSINDLTRSVSDLSDRRIPNLIHFGQLETHVFKLRGLSMSVFKEDVASSTSANNIDKVIDSRKKTWTAIDETMQKIEAVPRFTQVTKDLHAKLLKAMDEFRNANAPLNGALQKMVSAAASGDAAQFSRAREGYRAALDNVLIPFTQVSETMIECADKQAFLGERDGRAAVEDAKADATLIATMMVIGILCGVLVGFVILRAVLNQIGGEPAYIQSIMQRVSDADLSVKVDLRPNDTTSALHAVALTIARLRDIVDIINSNANEIAAASEELSAASERIAAASESQSQAATSMAASVEQMTVSINHVSNSASDANKMAQQSGEAAREGADTIRSVVADICRVANDIGGAAKSVEDLGEQSREIASVVNIIKEVADQTNLLALNAAIEAARAGEQGRGFAVVADEVRKLAERTSASTEDIARIVGLIGNGTTHAVQTMRQQSEGVKTTVELSERAGATVGKINNASDSVLNAVSEISLALSEQTSASTEIARNVENIASMSEDNTAAVREVAQATRALSSRAAQLQETVNRFRL